MTQELLSKPEVPGPNAPTASLTDVKVGRRRKVESTRKRGDLTAAVDAEILGAVEAASEPEPRELVPHIELFHQLQLAGPAKPPREEDPIDHDPLPESIEPAIELADEFAELETEDAPQLALPAPAPMPPVPAAPPSLYVVPSDDELEVVEPEIAEPPPVAEPRRVEPLREYAATPEARPRSDDEIIDYWDSLRGEQVMPLLSDLDRDWIGRCWPNSLILAVGEAEVTSPRITRLGEAREDVEFTPMVIEWILARGRHSARRGMPVEEEQRFPVSRGSARYRLILLPLGNGTGRSNHVLCRICPTQDISAAAAFKRWLAS